MLCTASGALDGEAAACCLRAWRVRMHGLIFVTWERYLTERFGSRLVEAYRAAIGETAANAPLTQRLYDDALLLPGLGPARPLTRTPPATFVRADGHSVILNGL